VLLVDLPEDFLLFIVFAEQGAQDEAEFFQALRALEELLVLGQSELQSIPLVGGDIEAGGL